MTDRTRLRGQPPLRPSAVPILSNWSKPDQPFRGNDNKIGIDNPSLTLSGFRDRAAPTFEAQIGEWNTLPAAILDLLARHRLATARIVVEWGINHAGFEGRWTGTGFLVEPDILLTNFHVLNSIASARNAVAQFAYLQPSDTLGRAGQPPEPLSVDITLDPSRLFVTSPASGGLDYCFVGIDPAATAPFGSIPMERGSFTTRLSEPVFVIHHPKGRLQEVSVDDTETIGINEDCLLYAADTDEGSSGAPVFNKGGRLVALHHATRDADQIAVAFPQAAALLRDARKERRGNEGIKIAAIAVDLEAKSARADASAAQAAEVLRRIRGSDTLTGVYGALGRHTAAGSDHESTLALYRAGDQDIDLGFWNLGWMDRDSGKEDAAALGMVDINLDLWCLTEAPEGTVDTIARAISDRFGEEVVVLPLGEAYGGPSTRMAAIYRKGSLRVAQQAWPAAVEAAFRAPVESLGAPVFAYPPARLVIGCPGEDHPAAHVVCYDLPPERATSAAGAPPTVTGGDRRARLASRLLVRAIDRAIATEGSGADWIIGGRFDVPLARDDAATLAHLGFDGFALQDVARGNAISYLRGPDSHVQKVWTTREMVPQDDAGQFVERRPDRTVDKFFAALANSGPATLRLTLHGGGRQQVSDDLAGEVDSILAPAGAPAKAPPAASPATGLDMDAASPRIFFERNAITLDAMCRTAAAATGGPLPAIVPTEALNVLFLLDGSVKQGRIDPDGHHSSGARGFMPLPASVAGWVGPDVPAWNAPMPLEANIDGYLRYLTALMNRDVTTIGGLRCYRDLFRHPGISGNRSRTVRLLLSVLDGVFLPGNYPDADVPLQRLLAAHSDRGDIDKILVTSRFDAPALARHRERMARAEDIADRS